MAKTIYRVRDPLPVWKIREYYVEVDEDKDIWEAISEYDGPMLVVDEERIDGMDDDPVYEEVKSIPKRFKDEAE